MKTNFTIGRRTRLAAAVCAAVLAGSLAGCVSAPTGPMFLRVASIPEGEGVIYIYRPSTGLYAGGADVQLTLDGRGVGRLPSYGYAAIPAKAGTHVVSGSAPHNPFMPAMTAGSVPITVVAGQSYYVKVAWKPLQGMAGPGHISFESLPEVAAMLSIPTMRLRPSR